ncbi:MAG: hypothetical protein AB9873_17915 [Syntrophobacteraceae bacterium]
MEALVEELPVGCLTDRRFAAGVGWVEEAAIEDAEIRTPVVLGLLDDDPVTLKVGIQVERGA